MQNGVVPKTENGVLPWVKLIDNFDAKYEFLANNETEFFFCTTLNAPRKRVIAIDIKTNEQREIIPQHETNVLEWVAPIGIVFNQKLFLYRYYTRNW